MGRLFLETLSDSSDAGGAIYACVGCGAELASSSALVWEGFMGGDHTPALLFRSAVNCAPTGAPRTETLSTGRYDLVDVACRACGAALGWRYLRAETGAERYKEGALLLGKARLRVGGGGGGNGLRAGGGGNNNNNPDPEVRRLDDRFWEALRAARAAAAARDV